MAAFHSTQKISRGGLAPWQVQLALSLLRFDLSVAFPIEMLAGRCGLSRCHFIRMFKVSLGTTPHRWLMYQRVCRAVEMLDGSDQRISLIALSCGFADQSHLTRIFHAAMGASPAAWRRQRKAASGPFLAISGTA